MFSNPYVRAIAGGIAAAIAVASPIVDDGVTVSEILSIVAAFMSGAGLTAVPNARTLRAEPKHRAERTYL